MELRTYAQRLSHIMAKHGESASSLNKKTGISIASIQYLMERGKSGSKHTDALCEYFNINKEWLVNGTGPISSDHQDNKTDQDLMSIVIKAVLDAQDQLLSEGGIKKPFDNNEIAKFASIFYNQALEQGFDKNTIRESIKFTAAFSD